MKPFIVKSMLLWLQADTSGVPQPNLSVTRLTRWCPTYINTSHYPEL